MDAYEVSNREYKKFVDAGGYQKPELWKHPFFKDGKPISWQQAMEEFRDSTRRPGPASWQLGTYPDGAAAMPVGGVSWYEAAAYAEFANKSLPTIYEWFYASGWGSPNSDILAMSNFRGKGPAETGTHRGMAAFGTYDMAGNVNEWTFNATDGRSRYLLGGAWDQEPYVFRNFVWADPLARSVTDGFRCVQRTSPPPPESLLPIPIDTAAPKRDKPVDDATFQIFSRLQAYDKMHLDAKVEEVDDSSPFWRRETVTFPAAYGGERMMLHLFLPKNAAPPYQVVAVFGGSNVLYTTHVQDFQFPYEFLLRSGRAVVFPVFSGTLERGPSPARLTPNQQRELSLRWPKDMGMTIDYLETRKDIDAKKLGFYGLSMGATQGVRLTALESRFKAAVLVSGGLYGVHPAEIDAWNYAPRVRTPVLMLSGRDDMVYPVETAQKPLFHALGTPAQNKRYVQFDGGHANLVSRPDLIGQILEWFDHYLGPVQARL
jgi:dienelactone hydrolase